MVYVICQAVHTGFFVGVGKKLYEGSHPLGGFWGHETYALRFAFGSACNLALYLLLYVCIHM